MASTSTASSSQSSLPPSAFNPRRHVGVHAERVTDVSSTEYPGHYPDEDHSWDLAKFKENLRVEVKRLSQRSIEFDLVGVDASISNAFRRILIAEVPTIAIENVYVWNNTSVIHDEVLAHRIGLVPLNVDPTLFEFRDESNRQPTDRNTIVFKLQVECRVDTDTPKEKGAPKRYVNEIVRSGDLVWVPQGEQEAVMSHTKPGPTNKASRNIVLAKLRPGQEIEMDLHAIKGVGKEHAKWSPVATASYRLHPLIILKPDKPVPPEHAHKFAKCFSPGVIQVGPNGEISVDERSLRNESMSREVLRHKEFEGCVELKRIRDWFIFNVESEGPYKPQDLFAESIKVMRQKLTNIRQAAEALSADVDGAGVHPNGVATADGDVEMAGV
ncbi:uncharacterized protein LAESUDRAFT_657174 [Laetiporus sulphureus 93-53]|uniref:DNA-directed RNA polymerases I and III subunit RPAC1 n=1 Tax=Laetiporus sulphureus 93-53 TaxID=1314785 RepID=A0A165DFS7_9APHY|nr:uncharacterized protein LAESUDRAFT_657174 [Laetiporus sulphureus 93-53]KZT04796.1 hypothetical protein LAESUDRAFT_657174 [Laetiporus sulphureus 93-53]